MVNGVCTCAVIVREGNSALGVDACSLVGDNGNTINMASILKIRHLEVKTEVGTVRDKSNMFMDTPGRRFYVSLWNFDEICSELDEDGTSKFMAFCMIMYTYIILYRLIPFILFYFQFATRMRKCINLRWVVMLIWADLWSPCWYMCERLHKNVGLQRDMAHDRTEWRSAIPGNV